MFSGKEIDYQDVLLTNDGFWPDLNLRDFQRSRSIPADIDADTLANALLASVSEVNLDLRPLAAELRDKGYPQAADAPGITMNGQTALIGQYKKAVFARAKADLLGEYSTQFSRVPNAGQENPETRSRLLAESSTVLRNMKGVGRCSVRMI
ncbi:MULTISPECIES: head completion/stabilization protein [Yersinia]|uniref:head completion/stabilization protein n=1 Tax=Yersinia TaxID=629 RepID=UPI000EAE1D45|nr:MULTISPECIES: head completion/stabilization protein [Yersinia]MCK8585529.1 head completion/stabilization protein [Yersinia ruckeri]UZY11913.1 head completion/stabilization protein [Yersinia ruckeri]